MALILEVLGGRNRVRARLRLDAFPVRIGRGLDNDLVLDDPYVDAQHVCLTRDEADQVVVEDLGSVNGIVPGRAMERVTRVAAVPGMELRLGRTVLRFRDTTEPVPPALRDTEPARRAAPAWSISSAAQIALGIVTVIAFGAAGWSGSYEPSAGSDTLMMTLGVGLVGLVWSGIWGFVGRIGVQRFRFVDHLTLFSFAVLLLLVWGTIAEWAAFVFPDNGVTDLLGAMIGAVLIAVLVTGHLGLATALSARRRWVAGIVTSVLIFSLVGLDTVGEETAFSDVPEFAGTIKAVAGGWLPTQTVAEFSVLTAELMDEVDTLVK